MIQLSPDERCTTCNGLLVAPHMVAEFAAPSGAEYICLRCGRPYRWMGQPPRLDWVSETARGGTDEGDEGDDDS